MKVGDLIVFGENKRRGGVRNIFKDQAGRVHVYVDVERDGVETWEVMLEECQLVTPLAIPLEEAVSVETIGLSREELRAIVFTLRAELSVRDVENERLRKSLEFLRNEIANEDWDADFVLAKIIASLEDGEG